MKVRIPRSPERIVVVPVGAQNGLVRSTMPPGVENAKEVNTGPEKGVFPYFGADLKR